MLQEEVQTVTALAAAEEDAERLEGLDGQPVTVGQRHLAGEEVVGDTAGPLDVLRIAGVVRGDLALHAGVGGPVDVVGVGVEGGQTAGEDGGGEALGGEGQIGGRAEAAEALAQDGPGAPPVTWARIASQSRTMESARKRAR